MKAKQLKYIAVAGVLALSLANHSFAVDVAESTSVLEDLESLAVKAQKIIAEGALDKNLDTVEEGGMRWAAITNAVEAGRVALADMEQAVADGDESAAQDAEDALAAALGQAKEALSGVLPEKMADEGETAVEPEQETGLPNIYDEPWQSEGIRAYYQSLFNSFNDASSYGGDKVMDFDDEDATRT